jgi:hypothetical protein
MEAELVQRRDLSAVLGWYDRSADEAKTDSAVAKKALEDLKTTFPDIGAAEKDFETAIPKIIAAFSEQQRKNAELQTRIKSLEGELVRGTGTPRATSRRRRTRRSARCSSSSRTSSATPSSARPRSRDAWRPCAPS